MRRAARIDGNHPEIVKALKAVGCSVLSLAALGRGVPDLLVARNGVNLLLEVKVPESVSTRKDGYARRERGGELRQAQAKWAAEWRARVYVVRTADEAIAAAERACREKV